MLGMQIDFIISEKGLVLVEITGNLSDELPFSCLVLLVTKKYIACLKCFGNNYTCQYEKDVNVP